MIAHDQVQRKQSTTVPLYLPYGRVRHDYTFGKSLLILAENPPWKNEFHDDVLSRVVNL